MRSLSFSAFFVLSWLFAALPATASEMTLVCESSGHDYTFCPVRKMYRKSIRLSWQKSSSPCIEGNSWGTNRDGIWVDKGCRAEFSISHQRFHDGYDDRGHGRWQDPPDNAWDDDSSNWDDDWAVETNETSDNSTAAAVAVGVGLVALIAAAASDNGAAADNPPAANPVGSDFVSKACNQWADAYVKGEAGGRYAEMQRLREIEPFGNGYRLKAYYHRYYDDLDDVSPATCEVNEQQRVTRFVFR